MLDTIYGQIGGLVVILTCGFAFWKGEWSERRAAAVLLGGWIAAIVMQDQAGYDAIGVMAVDLVMLIALGLIAWYRGKDWAIWATACQAIVVATHFAYLMDFQITVRSYLNALAVIAYIEYAILVVGTFFTWREREALRMMSPDRLVR